MTNPCAGRVLPGMVVTVIQSSGLGGYPRLCPAPPCHLGSAIPIILPHAFTPLLTIGGPPADGKLPAT